MSVVIACVLAECQEQGYDASPEISVAERLAQGGFRSVAEAERYIQVSNLAGQIPQIAELGIPVSGLYLLAAPTLGRIVRVKLLKRRDDRKG